MKTLIALLSVVVLTLSVNLFTGCASVKSGSDPIIVRAEQVESGALASFIFVINFDNSDRGFWKTNAPAFHNFAEWLRTPVGVDSLGNTQRRGLQMISNVDSLKVAYKSNASQSNALQTAIATLAQAVSQAQSWTTIVTTQTP